MSDIVKTSIITQDYIFIKFQNRGDVNISFFNQSSQSLIAEKDKFPMLDNFIQTNDSMRPNKIFGVYQSTMITFDTLNLCSFDKTGKPGFGCFERCLPTYWNVELTGKCVRYCPPNYSADLSNQLCIPSLTIPNCKIQRKSSICLLCDTGYALLHSKVSGLNYDTCVNSTLCNTEVWEIILENNNCSPINII